MKKLFFVWSCLLYCNFFSQNITFTYELKYRLNLDKADYKNELFYLDTSDKESVFRSEQDKYSDSLIEKTGYGLGHKLLYNHQYYTHKNFSEKKISKIIITPFFGDIYALIIEDLVWKISDDTFKISNFTCQKAELIYGGRRWTAWFTKEILCRMAVYF
ncbi:GLPGLI family protein [Chryseobacterium arthrosphaerae]|uniref:GLPGLI family protein n=1 Tax=Chryseobacterium arthrosphaerae TaxID=651561 RepID=A0A432E0F9_9FLAO|nr:GLPGLI family protein [Chryseobacterium arthrosphaerae]